MAKEHFPCRAAALWPVGNDDDAVVVAPVTAPDRETEVVAGQELPPPSFVFYHRALRACRIVAVFAAVAEEMALVIPLHVAVGEDEIVAVEVDVACRC